MLQCMCVCRPNNNKIGLLFITHYCSLAIEFQCFLHCNKRLVNQQTFLSSYCSNVYWQTILLLWIREIIEYALAILSVKITREWANSLKIDEYIYSRIPKALREFIAML